MGILVSVMMDTMSSITSVKNALKELALMEPVVFSLELKQSAQKLIKY